MPTTAVIFDLAILFILLLFALFGAHRGLLLSLFSLVAVVVAFIGASFVADLFAPKVADYLEPKFAYAIEAQLEEQMHAALPSPDRAQSPATDGQGQEPPLQDILNILKDMGLYQSAVDAINDAVESGMTDVAAGTAAAVAASIAGTVAYMILFVIAFVVVLVLWTILAHALDLVAHLPGLSALNKTGGALLGLLKGCAILFLCAWVLRYLGNIIPESFVQETKLLHFFMTTNPIALLFGAKSAIPTL